MSDKSQFGEYYGRLADDELARVASSNTWSRRLRKHLRLSYTNVDRQGGEALGISLKWSAHQSVLQAQRPLVRVRVTAPCRVAGCEAQYHPNSPARLPPSCARRSRRLPLRSPYRTIGVLSAAHAPPSHDSRPPMNAARSVFSRCM